MFCINSKLSFTERFCSGVIVDANAEFENGSNFVHFQISMIFFVFRNEYSFLVIEDKKKRQDTVRTRTCYRVFCISKFITRDAIIKKQITCKKHFSKFFTSHEIIFEREKIMQFFN